MKILVTGATGFVGSVLMPELIRVYGTNSVSAFLIPGDKIPRSWADQKIRLFYGDVADGFSISAAVAGHSHVIHLAGLISYWKNDAAQLIRVNRDGVRCVVDACLCHGVERMVHISSVGAIGFNKDGQPADETAPFNWPANFYYMTSKHEGQKIVEEAVERSRLRAVILNPASIMGPGDHNCATPHNQLYHRICSKGLIGSFAGGLATVDVRDLVALILKVLHGGRIGEKYLVVGANLRYRDVVRIISRCCGRKAYPIPLPPFLVAVAGGLLELWSRRTKKRPLLTYSYGRLSGWTAYYSNEKSRREFSHSYIPIERTIRDSWEYFKDICGGCE